MLVKGPAVQWGTKEVLEGTLWLEGRVVGRVRLRGRDGPWHFGRFVPEAAFAEFSPTFAAWSRLMHDGNQGLLSHAQRSELAKLERAIDRWQAWIVSSDGMVHPIRQLNVDDSLIEWKE